MVGKWRMKWAPTQCIWCLILLIYNAKRTLSLHTTLSHACISWTLCVERSSWNFKIIGMYDYPSLRVNPEWIDLHVWQSKQTEMIKVDHWWKIGENKALGSLEILQRWLYFSLDMGSCGTIGLIFLLSKLPAYRAYPHLYFYVSFLGLYTVFLTI